MIDIEYFGKNAGETRRVLEAMSRLASARTGQHCTFSLTKSLDAETRARVLELQTEAFGVRDAAFTASDLDEVNADPDALFIRFDVDSRMEGCCFGYWEWPDQITIPGTDFFLDSAMISAPFRGKGVGRLAISGVLLIAKLLDCARIGVLSWGGGPHSSRLLHFYRQFGFIRVLNGRNTGMVCMLDDELIARFLIDLELTPEGYGLPRPGNLWPRADERALVGRFYGALALSEVLYVVAPFEFAYLFLVLERPYWAVGVTVAGIIASMLAAIPGGVFADRHSRKTTVLVGGVLAAAGLTSVPFSVTATGTAQLMAVCASFIVAGAGQSLISAAAEAWIVDNLMAAGRPDLTQTFFARMSSVSALGAAIAGSLGLVLLLRVVNRTVLDLLWYMAGMGFLTAVVMAARIPERRPHRRPDHDERSAWMRMRSALEAFGKRRALLMIAGAIILGMASGRATQEAFSVSLITKQFDARWFAPLSVVDSLMGALGPVLGLFVARRLGASRMLVITLGLEVAALAILFVRTDVAAIVALYILLDLLDDAWDPVALARLQALTPSAHRATIVAMVYQLGAAAQLLAVGAFGLMLSGHRAEIEEATPDLLEAFSGKASHAPALPAVWLGLSVPDLAIVLFIALSGLAIPMLLVRDRAEDATEAAHRRHVRMRQTRRGSTHVAG